MLKIFIRSNRSIFEIKTEICFMSTFYICNNNIYPQMLDRQTKRVNGDASLRINLQGDVIPSNKSHPAT